MESNEVEAKDRGIRDPDGGDVYTKRAEDRASVFADARRCERSHADGSEPEDAGNQLSQQRGARGEKARDLVAARAVETPGREADHQAEDHDRRDPAIHEDPEEIVRNEGEEEVQETGSRAGSLGSGAGRGRESGARLHQSDHRERNQLSGQGGDEEEGPDSDQEPADPSGRARGSERRNEIEEDQRHGNEGQQADEDVPEEGRPDGRLPEHEPGENTDAHPEEHEVAERRETAGHRRVTGRSAGRKRHGISGRARRTRVGDPPV